MQLKNIFKFIILLSLSGLFFYTANVFAQAQGLDKVAENITGTFGALAKLITAVAYVAGMGFGMAAILKFKAHKDNPTQIPIGTPIALLFVSAALLFLPTLFGVAGQTVFGQGKTQGGVTGITSFS